jgi:6-phosphogluconolactonase
MKNVELLSFAGADELASVAASAWLDEIESANRAGKPHCVALSGGRVTQKFFAATVEQAQKRGVSFGNVHFFWADERCVPPTDPESNYKMADELLFQPLKISAENLHRLRGELPAALAVKLANEEYQKKFPVNKTAGQNRTLDLIFLGMGEDGHVASLFPHVGTTALNWADPFLAVENSPKPPPARISLSYNAIDSARQVWVLVSGGSKAEALRKSLRSDGRTPLARVLQSRSRTKIFSDIRLD